MRVFGVRKTKMVSVQEQSFLGSASWGVRVQEKKRKQQPLRGATNSNTQTTSITRYQKKKKRKMKVSGKQPLPNNSRLNSPFLILRVHHHCSLSSVDKRQHTHQIQYYKKNIGGILSPSATCSPPAITQKKLLMCHPSPMMSGGK